MSYQLKKRYGRRPGQPVAMGDVMSLVNAGISASNDPYLSEVLCHLQQLEAIKNGTPMPPCAKTPANIPGGIGLSRAVVPMRAYVYAESHKWIYAVAALGIIGLPLFVGYQLGKGH